MSPSIPEDIATKLAGHKQLSLTYNLYSKYKNKDELWQYVERIHEADCLKFVNVDTTAEDKCFVY